MKYILIAICLLPMTGIGQTGGKYQLKKQVLPASLVFLAGIADGLVETISHDYSGFKKAFPNANDRWYSPQLSFMNKYKNGDPAQGAKFPGSTTVLVFTTDAYHLGRFLDHLLTAGAFAIKITQGKKKWYWYACEVAGYWILNRIAFSLTYGYFKSLN